MNALLWVSTHSSLDRYYNCGVEFQFMIIITQVKHGWLRDPANSGEVIVNGLSVGQHHFACSVGDHCQQGMSFTVTVESGEGDISPQDAEQEVSTA